MAASQPITFIVNGVDQVAGKVASTRSAAAPASQLKHSVRLRRIPLVQASTSKRFRMVRQL